MIDKVKLYQIIQKEVVYCKLCKLCNGRNNAVPGRGNLDSKIMFIGEAPGKNEDNEGLPFVGFAGKILEKALEKAGIQKNDVYITNIVKCRPPNNRVPENDEVYTCVQQYLKKEIQLISPDIVCILGATALYALLNLKGLQKYHGKTINLDGISYFITFHPAATIYKKELRDTFFNEITSVVKMINTRNFENIG
ncbi:MAG: uracil-DNA glycosylase [Candidatus Nitrosocosmicus sp.]